MTANVALVAPDIATKLLRVPQLAAHACHSYVVVIDDPPPVFQVPSSAVSVLPMLAVPVMNGTDVFDGATTPART